MRQSVYDRMAMSGPEILGPSRMPRMSGVDIVGNPAMGVAAEAAGDAIKYKVAEYTAADQIHFGIASPAATIDAGAVGVVFQRQVSTPFKPEQVSLRSTDAPFLVIVQVQIGPTLLIDGDPIAAENWSEVSFNNDVQWPTAETSQFITFTLNNLDLVNARRPGITLRGWRLRK